MGDSNLSRIPPFSTPDLQIDSFPGATFRHMYRLMEKTVQQLEVEILILPLGINNRHQQPQMTIKEVQRLYKIAQLKFPNAQIVFPIINYSENLPQQENILELNGYLECTYNHLIGLSAAQFSTETDGIRLTPTTAESLLQHWILEGNWHPPLTCTTRRGTAQFSMKVKPT